MQDRQRNKRLARRQKPHREQPPEHNGAGEQANDPPRAPRIIRAAPGQRQHQRERGADHQTGADHVELVRPIVARQCPQRALGHDQRDRAERQIDPENQRPMQMIGQHSAQHRTENAGAHEHDRGAALHHRTFARRQQIGDDSLRDRQQAAAADALQTTRENQHPDILRQRTGDRTGDENADRP